MSTAQSPQDEIAAIQATLARHAEDLERIKAWLPEIPESLRQTLEQRAAEFTAAHERIERELNAIRERQDAQAGQIVDLNSQMVDLNSRMVDLNSRMVDLNSRMVDLNSQMVAINNQMVAINSRLGNITGTRYERRVARRIRSRLSRIAGLYQSRTLHTDWGETSEELTTLLDQAEDDGAITEDERDDLMDADIIATGQDAAGNVAYAVVEIGLTVSSTDVNRAARRAGALAKATGAECAAIVAGNEVPTAEQERATRTAVNIISIADRTD